MMREEVRGAYIAVKCVDMWWTDVSVSRQEMLFLDLLIGVRDI